ncbi:hypothetical protein RUM43_004611 [Polyplax serrata]|uniref:Uncharacterized protein n=1 Tax=Polyplax serrata TaxID=468196 RepID=A0AAN8SB21_POLSC
MNLPEDRHPLLYVYVDVDHQQPDKFRSRCISRGATALLGKWPDHLTFSWMMGVIGLVSLLTCFLIIIVALVMASAGHHYGRRSLLEKCERNAHVVQFVHMKNLEDLTVNENATYFVEILTNDRIRNDSLCSIESFLKKTTSPVFLVLILVNSSQENLTSVEDLERAHTNFVTITFDMNTFFNRTLFANFQSNDPKFLTFLAKILVSWNVGGTVLDTKLKYLKDRNTIFPADEKDVSLGTYENDVVLISVKRFCHAYIFDILKTIAETRDIVKYNQVEIIENAKKRFCRGKWNCRGVKFVPSSTFCTVRKKNDNCAFLVSKPSKEMNTTQFHRLKKTLVHRKEYEDTRNVSPTQMV